jgi:tripartite-type tricarboxylate transporter receptor subunit TctC
LLAEVPIILTVRKDLPVKDFKEFVEYATKNQNKMQFGSAGAGSATHLGCVLLNYLLKTNINHIPYKGTGPAMIDLAAGRIDFLCEIITTAKPHVDGGTVRAMAIFDKTRSKALPNLATAIEQGGPKDLIAYTWNAIFLPKGAPPEIVNRLNAAAVEAMKSPQVADKLAGLGAKIATPSEMTSQYLADLVKSEIAKWSVPIKASGVIIE